MPKHPFFSSFAQRKQPPVRVLRAWMRRGERRFLFEQIFIAFQQVQLKLWDMVRIVLDFEVILGLNVRFVHWRIKCCILTSFGSSLHGWHKLCLIPGPCVRFSLCPNALVHVLRTLQCTLSGLLCMKRFMWVVRCKGKSQWWGTLADWWQGTPTYQWHGALTVWGCGTFIGWGRDTPAD